MAAHPAPAPPRKLSAEERQELVHKAFETDQAIKKALAVKHRADWNLARCLYEFHEEKYWQVLDPTATLNEWLAQPEIGLSRSEFFRGVQVWERLVVGGRVPLADLEDVQPSKVQTVMPAIIHGDVAPEDAIDDAKALGWRDLQQKYRHRGQRKSRSAATSGDGEGADEDIEGPLDAAQEPERTQCPVCGSWVLAEQVVDSTAEEDEGDG